MIPGLDCGTCSLAKKIGSIPVHRSFNQQEKVFFSECAVAVERRIDPRKPYFQPGNATDHELDRLTRFAADLFQAPIAVISSVDPDRIAFVSQSGRVLPAYDSQGGFCGSCVLHDKPWIISDAASDPHTASHPHVRDAGVRFYCGAPLITPDAVRVGALAVMDVVPREAGAHDVERIQALAHMAMRELELRRSRDEALMSYQTELVQREIREDHIRGLLREVTHRSKNMLAVVLAFARQSSKKGQSANNFRAQLISRIEGLAHTQDLVAEADWQGADLGRLITSQLTPYLTQAQQLHQIGPVVSLLPSAAQHVGMALQELAANSVRRGALSTDKGFVSVSWKVEADPPCLRLFWREHGGPLVAAPTKPGFGHVLLERVVPQAMDGLGRLSFEPAGLGWQLEVPTGSVLAHEQ
jgi:two-component sensor histidine kinase